MVAGGWPGRWGGGKGRSEAECIGEGSWADLVVGQMWDKTLGKTGRERCILRMAEISASEPHGLKHL